MERKPLTMRAYGYLIDKLWKDDLSPQTRWRICTVLMEHGRAIDRIREHGERIREDGYNAGYTKGVRDTKGRMMGAIYGLRDREAF